MKTQRLNGTIQSPETAALEWVKRVLHDTCPAEISRGNSLPEQLVAIAAANNVPVETLIWWIQDAPHGKEWTAAAWRNWVKKYTETAAALDRAQTLILCRHCLAAPTVALGEYLVCPNGCPPEPR